MKNRTVPAKFSNVPSTASRKHLGHITGPNKPVFSKSLKGNNKRTDILGHSAKRH